MKSFFSFISFFLAFFLFAVSCLLVYYHWLDFSTSFLLILLSLSLLRFIEFLPCVRTREELFSSFFSFVTFLSAQFSFLFSFLFSPCVVASFSSCSSAFPSFSSLSLRLPVFLSLQEKKKVCAPSLARFLRIINAKRGN